MKKLLASILISITILVSLAPFFQARAAGIEDLWIHEWYGETNPFSWYDKVFNPQRSPPGDIFGERYTAAQVQWVTYGFFSMLWNLIPGNPELTTCTLSGTNISTCITGVMNKLNLLTDSSGVQANKGLAATIFDFLKKSPVSGVAYTANLANKFSPVATVKAQEGFGFTAASSVQLLWRGTRNISYGLLTLAAVVLAFMIMFRVKLSPQVVISVQSAIPKLVIALLLITFSYAIAGFLIDIMYVVIGLISLLISKSGIGLSTDSSAGLFTLFTKYYSVIGVLYLYWLNFMGSALVSIFESGSGFGWGILIFIFSIVAVLAIIWWSLKLFFEMIKNFVMILLSIVSAPLEILLGTIMPGMGFGKWLKRFVSYLAFYPVMIVLVFLSFFFLFQGGKVSEPFYPDPKQPPPFSVNQNMITGTATWNPPFSIGTARTGGYNVLMWVLVSWVIFAQIPKTAKMIQSFMAGKPFEYESGIGEVTGAAGKVAGTAPAQYGIGTIQKNVGTWLSGLGQPPPGSSPSAQDVWYRRLARGAGSSQTNEGLRRRGEKPQ